MLFPGLILNAGVFLLSRSIQRLFVSICELRAVVCDVSPQYIVYGARLAKEFFARLGDSSQPKISRTPRVVAIVALSAHRRISAVLRVTDSLAT